MSRGNNCHGESCHLGYEKPWLQILYTTLYRIQLRSVTQSIPSLPKIAPGGITADITTPILPDLISANQTKRDTKVADQSWTGLSSEYFPQVFLELPSKQIRTSKSDASLRGETR